VNAHGRLTQMMEKALAGYHHSPERLQPDIRLLRSLLGLYDEPPERVWGHHLAPFIRRNKDALRAVYDEHATLPTTEILDRPEALLLLERIEHDRARVRQAWPYDMADLEPLRDVWGIRL
jgi:hypothetical protein